MAGLLKKIMGGKKQNITEEASNENYSSSGQVYDRINELAAIGTAQAGSDIIELLYRSDNDFNPTDRFILEGPLVIHAISKLKAMEEGGAINIARLINSEKEALIDKIYMLRKTDPEIEYAISEFETHEDLAIDTILEMGNVAALRQVSAFYPEKAAMAASKMDDSNAVNVIIGSTITRFNNGLQDINIVGFNIMADMYKKVKAGELQNIDPDILKRAANELSYALLDVKKLTNCLKGGTYSDGILHMPIDSTPIDSGMINGLKSAFKKMHRFNLVNRETVNLLFDTVETADQEKYRENNLLRDQTMLFDSSPE